MLNEKHRFYGKTKLIELEKFKNIFNSQKFEYVDAILLFGSRAIGTFHERSDYDFAVLLKRDKVNAWGEMSRIWVDIGHNFNCPIVPQKGSDAFEFMYDMGLIEDELFSTMKSAIGLRNAMIHDYMNFNDKILKNVVVSRRYSDIIRFLKSDINYSSTQLKRIENFFLN